jgi:ATP-dependent DNA helicase DinG
MGAAELLGPGGPFADVLPGYEPRPGQLTMVAAVERCLTREGITLIEAGTGTGKTLGYLVPALLASGRKKIVISTATRALQDQIFYKDLPLVERALGLNVPVALMKGLPNYVCRRRYHEFSSSAESLGAEWSSSLPKLSQWLDSTQTGRIDELGDLGEDDPIWSRVAASSERRIGAGCSYFDRCYVTAMKREAARARLVVVNHHLFFADLAMRGGHPGSVIPDYDAVIFDEAHQLEDAATEHFGLSVSLARLGRLCNDARHLLERESALSAGAHARHTYELSEQFFDAIAAALGFSAEGRVPLINEAWSGAAEGAWFALDTALEGLAARLRAGELAGTRQSHLPMFAQVESERAEALGRRAQQLREDLSQIKTGRPHSVVWFESQGRARKLSASPVDVGSFFQTQLFDVIGSVVLTSATLSSGNVEAPPDHEDADGAVSAPLRSYRGPFAFACQRLGLNPDVYGVEELCVPSPFRFEEQALLYLPDDLPGPEEPGFGAALSERCLRLIEQSRGGAFLLTTSLRAMRGLHRDLLGKLPPEIDLMVQGQAPKSALLERFRAAGNAVLVATSSFWQGVDIPGSALRLVVLDKAPFPVPSDPIVQARAEALTLAGESPFTRLHLPLAQLALKQGFGRLIRSQSDYGVVALLDTRVHRRGYGQRLLSGLPPAPRVTSLEEVAAFWQKRLPRLPVDPPVRLLPLEQLEALPL